MEFSYRPTNTHWHMWSRSPLRGLAVSASMEMMGTSIMCQVLLDTEHCPPTCAWMFWLRMQGWRSLCLHSPAVCIPPPRWSKTCYSCQCCPKLHCKRVPDAPHRSLCWFHCSVSGTWTLGWNTELVVSHILWRFTSLPPFTEMWEWLLKKVCYVN